MGRKAVDIKVKWQIVALKKGKDKEKLSNIKIAYQCGVSETCVRKTWAKYQETNDVISDTKFNRRPQKLTKHDQRLIFRDIRKYPRQSLRCITYKFNSLYPNRKVSYNTIRNVLKRKGINSYVASKKPFLTVLDRIKRIKWCREQKTWSVNQWANVIFSDESNFEVFNRKGRVFVKRFAHEKFKNRFVIKRLQGGGGSVGIWGCFSMFGTGVCNLYTGHINQHSYIETLKNCLVPSATLLMNDQYWLFQQDNAPAHTAKIVKEWFDENHIDVLPWCPRSPDLNPIENIWSWMDTQLAKVHCTSIEHLKENLHRIWLEIPINFCKNLIESMPRRINLCIKARGGYFKY
jgi:hypothetical protein